MESIYIKYKYSGSCTCDDGWAAPRCNECERGYFGLRCDKCVVNCNGHGQCNISFK